MSAPGFEWDEAKRVANLAKHSLDFDDMTDLFDGNFVGSTVVRGEELRVLATGVLKGKWITIVYTWRANRRRIISARAAREDERYGYRTIYR